MFIQYFLVNKIFIKLKLYKRKVGVAFLNENGQDDRKIYQICINCGCEGEVSEAFDTVPFVNREAAVRGLGVSIRPDKSRQNAARHSRAYVSLQFHEYS